MSYRLEKTVVMVGMMGAGKTAVGKVLARRLGVPFVDQDDEIESAANATIAEIFRAHGESFFRQKETQVLERLLKAPPVVLSTGGGAFLRAENRALIARHGVAVWLRAELSLLWSRVRNRNTRPLLQTEDPLQTLKTIYEARTPVYALAPVQVTSQPGWTTQQTADAVIAALDGWPGLFREVQNVTR